MILIIDCAATMCFVLAIKCDELNLVHWEKVKLSGISTKKP